MLNVKVNNKKYECYIELSNNYTNETIMEIDSNSVFFEKKYDKEIDCLVLNKDEFGLFIKQIQLEINNANENPEYKGRYIQGLSNEQKEKKYKWFFDMEETRFSFDEIHMWNDAKLLKFIDDDFDSSDYDEVIESLDYLCNKYDIDIDTYVENDELEEMWENLRKSIYMNNLSKKDENELFQMIKNYNKDEYEIFRKDYGFHDWMYNYSGKKNMELCDNDMEVINMILKFCFAKNFSLAYYMIH